MKGIWLTVALSLIAAVGCNSAPKREMRQPIREELISPPPDKYTTPPDYSRDQPLLQPKQSMPGLNTGGMPGMGGPMGPGGGGMMPGMAPGGMAR